MEDPRTMVKFPHEGPYTNPCTVLDCREASAEDLLKNLDALADALVADEVRQVWLKCDKARFLELRSRLTKLLVSKVAEHESRRKKNHVVYHDSFLRCSVRKTSQAWCQSSALSEEMMSPTLMPFNSARRSAASTPA